MKFTSMLFIGILLFAHAFASTTFVVSPSGTGTDCNVGNPCSINDAWSTSVAGDVITMTAGTYILTATLHVKAAVTLMSTIAGTATITCGVGITPAITIDGATAFLTGFSISGCTGTGIKVSNNNTVISNVAISGASVAITYDFSSNSSIQYCNINNVAAGVKVTSIGNGATGLTIFNSNISSVIPPVDISSSIGVSVDSTISGSIITGFSQNLLLTGYYMNVYNSVVSNGGVVYNSQNPISLTIDNSEFYGYYGNYSMIAGLYMSNLTITNSYFHDNKAALGTGCIEASFLVNFYMKNVTFARCTAMLQATGAVRLINVPTFYLDTITFVNNSGLGFHGGALCVENSAGTITGSTFINNSVVNDVNFSNQAAYGGAISVKARDVNTTVYILQSTFLGNTAEYGGGAIAIVGYANTPTFQPVVMSGLSIANSSAGSYGGGNLHVFYANASITNSILSNGYSAQGIGGISTQNSLLYARNVSLFGNSAGDITASGNITLKYVFATANVAILETYDNKPHFVSIQFGSFHGLGINTQSSTVATITNATLSTVFIDNNSNLVMTNVVVTNDNPYLNFCCASDDTSQQLFNSAIVNRLCSFPTLTVCGKASCNPTICSGNGTCNPNVTGTCSCNKNYMGANCQYYCNANTTCSAHGTCNIDGSCACAAGYAGPNCATCLAPLADPDAGCQACVNGYSNFPACTPCDDFNTCHDFGSCNRGPGAFPCTCQSQGMDPAANCTKCKPDTANFPSCNKYCNANISCYGNGVCNNNYSCECRPGFDVKYDCAMCLPGLYGPNCDVACNASTCNNHGICAWDGSCLCNSTYLGTPNCGACTFGFTGYPNCTFGGFNGSTIGNFNGSTIGNFNGSTIGGFNGSTVTIGGNTGVPQNGTTTGGMPNNGSTIGLPNNGSTIGGLPNGTVTIGVSVTVGSGTTGSAPATSGSGSATTGLPNPTGTPIPTPAPTLPPATITVVVKVEMKMEGSPEEFVSNANLFLASFANASGIPAENIVIQLVYSNGTIVNVTTTKRATSDSFTVQIIASQTVTLSASGSVSASDSASLQKFNASTLTATVQAAVNDPSTPLGSALSGYTVANVSAATTQTVYQPTWAPTPAPTPSPTAAGTPAPTAKATPAPPTSAPTPTPKPVNNGAQGLAGSALLVIVCALVWL